jgi:hypothetical protein
MNTAINQQRLTRRIFKSFALLTMLGVLGIAVLFVSLWLEHRFGLTLPKPTGPFTVGRALYDWTDDKTLDTLAPVPGTKRELLVWLWYPAADSPSAVIADYLPAPLRTAIDRQSGVLLSHFLTRDLSKVHAHSLVNVDVSSQQQSYPVVIMRAGASLEVASYATLAEDLASHGYVVVGVDAPYRTGIVAFSDGRVIKRTPENNPELCLERTGQQRDRCANRLLDAFRPFMFLLSDHSRESDAQTQQIKADIQSIYDHIPLNERLYVTIRGANHFTFSDDGALLKSHLVRGVLRAAGKLGIDGDRQIAVTAYCLHTFFDANLKRSVSPLMISSSLYPEIQVVE